VTFVAAALLILAPPVAAQAPDSLAITAQELGARLRFLSSDLFEGRYPGTRGEALTTGYLISELQGFGLRPGAAPAGTDTSAAWLQPVSILVHRPDSTSAVQARLSGRINRNLEPGREVGFSNYSANPEVRAGGELVFVGYGIHAPMYGWDDFAGTDLRGKIAVAIQGEPTLTGDSVRFNGVRASRFSWGSDKLAEMERRGAIGLLWLLPDGALRGPVRQSRHLSGDLSDARLGFMGGLTDSALARLLPPRSPPLRTVLESAAKRGFRAIPLKARLDVQFRTRPSTLTTHNVIGVIPGSDPRLASEHVVLSAHWDAYGIGPAVKGDSIYNGALDDGSGVTALLALARVFAHHPQRRSLTFLFTTAEEWGLFGAYAFVCAGPLPPERLAANLNLDDGIELLGVKRDAAPLGVELSTLGSAVAQVAAQSGLRVSPDPYPEEGFFLRADNFPFARAGVPALYMALGTDGVGMSRGFVDAKVKEYLDRHYHQPSDEYPTVVLDLEGSRQFAEFVRDMTIAVANEPTRPSWLPSAEFQRPQGTGASKHCMR
jgi:hypothetical protein